MEMSSDPDIARRIKRLIAISAVALGLIFLLICTAAEAGPGPTGLMIGGWATMPILLAGSLSSPRWRYLLAIPAGLVSASLLIVALGFEGSITARIGWWMMTAGVLEGGTLGGWFWYRWVPVPRPFDQPFSAGRWVLVALHAALVVTGGAFVAIGELL